MYMIICYTVYNGVKHDGKVLEFSNSRERLEYLLDGDRYKQYKDRGCKLIIAKALNYKEI
jgi:hypothetical protein